MTPVTSLLPPVPLAVPPISLSLLVREVEVKVEDEPEGEIVVGSGGEALRPPGKGTTSTLINSLFVLA